MTDRWQNERANVAGADANAGQREAHLVRLRPILDLAVLYAHHPAGHRSGGQLLLQHHQLPLFRRYATRTWFTHPHFLSSSSPIFIQL